MELTGPTRQGASMQRRLGFVAPDPPATKLVLGTRRPLLLDGSVARRQPRRLRPCYGQPNRSKFGFVECAEEY
jgi:hypothetical protein